MQLNVLFHKGRLLVAFRFSSFAVEVCLLQMHIDDSMIIYISNANA